MTAKSSVVMVAALIAGERDPRTLADLAKGPLRAKRDALAEALDGMFDSHHGVIAQMLLDQVAFLDQRIKEMEDQAIAALGPGGGVLGGGRGWGDRARPRHRPGLAGAGRRVPAGRDPRHQRVAGHRDHRRDRPEHGGVPHPGAPGLPGSGCAGPPGDSGTRHGKGKQKKGNSYARAAAGHAASAPAGTATFLGERYARIARRRGGAIAQVAVARSIMIIAWHLLSDPAGPLPRPRPGLARPPHRPGQEDPHPPPGPEGPRRHRHHHRRRTRRLTRTTGHRNALARPATSHSRRARVSMPARPAHVR